MHNPLVECVPNFSEGRDLKKLQKILDAIKSVEGAQLMDVDPGAETNRTVVTIVGPPDAVTEAAFQGVAMAMEVIDMSQHEGAHARHGATDVCPFVPVQDISMEECVELARSLGQRIGRELGLPVYLYDQAALQPQRRSLADVRSGEYEALPEKMTQPEWKPDFGPAEFNAKSGVVTVGAREFLIAYNVNLNSSVKSAASDLALEIREKGRAVRQGQSTPYYSSGRVLNYRPSKNEWPCGVDGQVFPTADKLNQHMLTEHDTSLADELKRFGRDPNDLENRNVMKPGTFTECRAVGWVIPEYNRAQISINLTNFHTTTAHEVLEECRRLATDRGLVVTGSEVVGMVPFEAMRESGEHYLKQQGASRGLPVDDIVETAVQSMGLRDVADFECKKSILGLPSTDGALSSMAINDFANEVSRPSPAPGGGSIAALAGSLSASLGSMVANLTFGKPSLFAFRDEMESIAIECQQLKDTLLRAIDADTDAFNDVLLAVRLPKTSEEEKSKRLAAIQAGYKTATQVPLDTARACLAAMQLCRRVAENSLPASLTDAAVGCLMAHSGVVGAVYNVRINLCEITDAEWVDSTRSQLADLVTTADNLAADIRALVESRL